MCFYRRRTTEVLRTKCRRIQVISEVRGRRQAHNPTLTKIMRLTYNRSCSHNRPQTAACNAVYSISRRALLITRLGEQLPRPRQVSMTGNLDQSCLASQNRWVAYGFCNNLINLITFIGLGCQFLSVIVGYSEWVLTKVKVGRPINFNIH